MTTPVLTRPLPSVLEDLRLSLIAAGFSAESPDNLSDEDKRLAREERWTER